MESHAGKIGKVLTAEAAADLRESFAASDNDGDGFIHFAEFDYLLDTVGSRLLPAARVLEFRSIDKDGDGLIDIQEFTAWCGR